MKRRRLPQPRVRPRNVVAQHEIDLGNSRPKSIAAQCFSVPRRQRVAVYPQQRRSARCRTRPQSRWAGRTVISTSAVSSPPCVRRSAISASVIARLPPTGIGQPTEWARVANIKPAAADANRRHPRNHVGGNAGEQRAGIRTGQRSPRRGALGEHPQPEAQRRRQRSGHRTLVAEQQSDHAARVVDQRSEQAPPGRTVCQFGAGALEVAVCDRRGSARQRVGIGDLWNGQLHAARGQIELARKTATPAPAGVPPSKCRVRLPGNSGSGAVRAPPPNVGCASTTCTFESCARANHGCGQPVGPAADDCDVHRFNYSWRRLAYSLVG